MDNYQFDEIRKQNNTMIYLLNQILEELKATNPVEEETNETEEVEESNYAKSKDFAKRVSEEPREDEPTTGKYKYEKDNIEIVTSKRKWLINAKRQRN